MPDPVVDNHQCPKGNNTKSTQNSYDRPRAVREWKDFEFDTLTEIYEGRLFSLLSQRLDLRDFSDIPEFPFRRYHDEPSLEPLLVKWNQSVVLEALEKSQPFLLETEDHIYMVRGGQADPPNPPDPQKPQNPKSPKSKPRKPDWGAVVDRKNKSKNLLPGDTKLSSKWSSSKIEPGEVRYSHVQKDWMRPLEQIYTYCLRNNTRYGYLITDAELLAVRVRLGQDKNQKTSFVSKDTDAVVERARDVGILDYKAIPWKTATNRASSTADGLTMNLALWWLHLIAIGDTKIGDNYGALRDEAWGPVTRNKTPSPSRADLTKVSIATRGHSVNQVRIKADHV